MRSRGQSDAGGPVVWMRGSMDVRAVRVRILLRDGAPRAEPGSPVTPAREVRSLASYRCNELVARFALRAIDFPYDFQGRGGWSLDPPRSERTVLKPYQGSCGIGFRLPGERWFRLPEDWSSRRVCSSSGRPIRLPEDATGLPEDGSVFQNTKTQHAQILHKNSQQNMLPGFMHIMGITSGAFVTWE